MHKKCAICKELFKPTRTWNKFCKKPECQREANRKRVKKYRKNNLLRVKNLEEMKTNATYKKNYEKIMKAFFPAAPFKDIFDEKNKDEHLKKVKGKYIKKYKEHYLKQHRKRFKKVTWNYLYNETGLSYDTLNKYIKLLREWGVIPEDCLKVNNYLEPIRSWYKSYIEHSPTNQLLAIENIAVFNKNDIFKDPLENELSKIVNLVVDLQEAYFKFCCSIWRIGLRKANDRWIDFIEKLKVTNKTKMYLWLELIRIHFLATNRSYNIKNGDGWYRKGMIFPVDKDEILPLKSNNYEKKVFTWSEKFTTLYHNAISKYCNDEFETVKKDFFKICETTLNIREKANDFITVLRPEIVSYFGIRDQYRDIYGMDNVGTIMKFTRNNRLPQTKKNQDDDPDLLDEERDSLKELDLLNSLGDEIINLGFQDEQHFYNELKYLANTFQMPSYHS